MCPDTVKHSETQECNTGSNSCVRSRNWIFTWNNYTSENIDTLLKYLEKDKYCFQEEKGKEGTPHLQGAIIFKNARTLEQVKKIDKKIHWEIAKNIIACRKYCAKIDTRNGKIYSNWELDEKQLTDYWDDDKMMEWQKEILELIKEEPDKRKIYWRWESVGNMGKTTLARHICLIRKDAIYVCGKSNDIKCAIASKKIKPKVIIWDMPRTNEGHISYSGIEQVKNGIFFSPKYESEMVIYDIPHIIILANFAPDFSALSLDRWDVKELALS